MKQDAAYFTKKEVKSYLDKGLDLDPELYMVLVLVLVCHFTLAASK